MRTDITSTLTDSQFIRLLIPACSDMLKKLSDKEWLIEAEGPDDIRPELFNLAVKEKNSVLSLQKENKKLEEVFQRLTNTS